MKILSIVTLISPLGEYGGPVRVALNQAKELMHLGHEVVIAAASRGFNGPLPKSIEGIPVELFPSRMMIPGIGFAGLASPQLQRRLKKLTRDVDVVHIHAARDLVTLPAANWVRRRRFRYVLQTHGMIDPSGNPLSVPFDAILTRPVLRAANPVFFLTAHERRDLVAVAGDGLKLRALGNGVPIPTVEARYGPPIEVLYLARLAPRKRPIAFIEMAAELAVNFPKVRFRLVGPDESEGAAVSRKVSQLPESVDIEWEGPVNPEFAIARMARASVYVLPSVDEPYPMSVLEAMSLGLPVVITDTCGLANLVQEEGCGIVVDDTQSSLNEAVRQLLQDPHKARRMGEAGRRATRLRLSMTSIGLALEAAYSE